MTRPLEEQHSTTVRAVPALDGWTVVPYWRAICTCGWRGAHHYEGELPAWSDAVQHQLDMNPSVKGESLMGLLAAKHDDDASAALSIAANRASKVLLLLDDGGRCDDIAARNVESLDADVEAFLKSPRGKRAVAQSPTLPVSLRSIVEAARAQLP